MSELSALEDHADEVILPIIALEAGFNGAVINITKDLNLYVRTDGNDENDGYADTSQHAFKTGTRAYQEAARYALGEGAQVIINFGAGVHPPTYAQGAISGSYQENNGQWMAAVLMRGKGPGVTYLNGSANAALYDAALLGGQGSRITVENLTIGANANNGLVASDGGIINMGANLAFGNTGKHIMAVENGVVKHFTDYALTTGGISHYYATKGGFIEGDSTVTIATPIIISDAFAVADPGGYIHDTNSNFNGTVTGLRFRVEPTGTIYTGAGGLNYFPGTIPGVIAPGGQYDSSGIPVTAAPKALSLQLPAVNDEVSMFYNKTPITLAQINSVVRGTTPSATWSLFYATNRNGATTTIVSGVVTNVQTNLQTTVFTNASIPINVWVFLRVTAVSGTVLELGLSLNF